MSFNPTVSIIINTDARAESLKLTLDSLRYLDYPLFEVCVVYGPTPDGTKELLEERRSEIKVAHCPTRNLSTSRNIGIAMAAGEIIAFLDDDSIPESEWLSLLVQDYARSDVGACGGFAHDNTGVGYQWRFGTVNRLGLPDQSWDHPPIECNFPYTANFPHLLGTNSSFRKSAVLSIGGFDEQYEYYLDESDLICRLVDQGWRIVPLFGANVHHKYAPSHLRRGRYYKSWYAIVKNRIYFSLINAHGHHGPSAALAETMKFVENLRARLEEGIAIGEATEQDRARFEAECDRALEDGLRAGFAKTRRLPDQVKLKCFEQPFLPFEVLNPAGGRKTLCFLTKTYPPASIGGIGRYVHQLARSIARLGHQIHVITSAIEHDTVDFEDGVWVHRIRSKPHSDPAKLDGLAVPQHIWDYSATMLSEAKKVAEARAVDAVFAPIWDCEGIAVLLDGTFRLVTSLHTTFKHFLDSHQHRKADTAFMDDFIRPMLAFEKLLLDRSDAVLANSKAIVCEVERDYDVTFSSARLGLVPHGLDDWATQPLEEPDPLPSGAVRVLYVGRLEQRKGIDVFLEAVKAILRAYPQVYIDVVGNKTLIGANNVTYQDVFKADRDADAVRDRVFFHGEVSETALRGYYRACDIFAAPSRFESFGLILLEAMMFGKPVIGCRAGGMSEIVEHGVSGLLAEPGDVSSLSACLQQLVADPQLRARLGAAGRRRYEAAFTSDAMARSTLDFVSQLPDKVAAPPTTTIAPSIHMLESDAIIPLQGGDALDSVWNSKRRVVVIHSVLARYDALSAAVCDTYHILASDPGLRVSVFACRNDFSDVPCHIVNDAAELLLHPDYLAADLIIWHFGVYYELFDAILLGNGKALQVVVFHNVTPKEYAPEWLWPIIDHSFRQCQHLRHADEVWSVSVVNADAARAIGVAEDRIRVIPLAVDAPVLGTLAKKSRSLIDILFVGRIVKTKGVLELIDTVLRLRQRGVAPFRVRLTGNEFSDPAYVKAVRGAIVENGLSQDVLWLGTADVATWESLYREAHILAIPSYHEGFCKPVIEGLRAGCIPIGYASYNLPYIANRLGRLVPTGNVEALTDALEEVMKSLSVALAEPEEAWLPLDRGKLSVAEFDRASRDYIQRFTSAQVRGEMLSRVYNLVNVKAL